MASRKRKGTAPARRPPIRRSISKRPLSLDAVQRLLLEEAEGWSILKTDGVTLGERRIVQHEKTYHFEHYGQPKGDGLEILGALSEETEKRAALLTSRAEAQNEKELERANQRLTRARWELWNEREHLKLDIATAKEIARIEIGAAKLPRDSKQAKKIKAEVARKANAKAARHIEKANAKSLAKQSRQKGEIVKAKASLAQTVRTTTKRYRGAYKAATGVRERALTQASRIWEKQKIVRELGFPFEVPKGFLGTEGTTGNPAAKVLEWVSEEYVRVQARYPNAKVFGRIRLVRVGTWSGAEGESPIFTPEPVDGVDSHKITTAWSGWKQQGNQADTIEAARAALAGLYSIDATFIPYVVLIAIRPRKD